MSYNPPSDSMALQDQLNSMSPEERKVTAQLITDQQYNDFQATPYGGYWSPQNDAEWLAVWCRNRDLSGFESAKQHGSLPLYIFTLPTKPIELLFYAAARRWPSDSWEGLGYALVPVLIVGSGFLWFKLFQWIRGN